MCGNPQGGGSMCHFHWREGLELICGEYSFLVAVFAILSCDNNGAYRRKGGHSQHHCGYDRTLSLCLCIDLVSV